MTHNTSVRRFEEMKELHQKYMPYYIEHIKEELNNVKNKEVKDMMENFVIKRLASNPGIRAYIFDKMWELLYLPKDSEFYKLCAGIEMQLAQTYSFNVGADKKGEYGKRPEIAFLTARIMKDIHKRYFSRHFPGKKSELWNVFKEIYDVFYSAQVFDTLVNLYPNLGKSVGSVLSSYLSMNDEEFFFKYGIEKEYLERVYSRYKSWNYTQDNMDEILLMRTYGINAHMIEMFPYLIKVMHPDVNNQKIKLLKNYGRYYGISMMITNDIQDFALDLLENDIATREKNRYDAFNDVLNQKVTWPLMYALRSGDKEVIDVVENAYKNPSPENFEILRKALVKKGYIKRSVLESMSFAYLSLDSVAAFDNAEAKGMLKHTSISMSLFSKYHKLLKERYGESLRPSKSLLSLRKAELSEKVNENGGIFEI